MFLGSIRARYAVVFIVASVVVFVGGVLVESKLTLQTDPVQWVNQSSQTIKDIHQVEEETGGTSELGVDATSDDVFSDEFVGFAHRFTQRQLEEHPRRLLTGSSTETVVGDITGDIPGASDVPPTGEEVKAALTSRRSGARRGRRGPDARSSSLA